MSQGSTTTESVYECSRESATIQLDNTHWINEFSEGIKLNKGDTVRLLGSFIQEGANSNEIEIETEQELNITYSPYLLGNTLDTIDKTQNGNLMDLSQIGDIAYSTDSYGIEPPMRNTTQKGTTTDYWNNNNLGDGGVDTDEAGGNPYPNNTAPQAAIPGAGIAKYDDVANSNPAATGEMGGTTYGNWRYNPWFINSAKQGENPVYTGGTTFPTDQPNMRGEEAATWGTNLKTSQFEANPKKQSTGAQAQSYLNFSENDVPTEMYIGHMIKKLILPVLHTFATGNTNADPTGATASQPNEWDQQSIRQELEPLLEDIPASGEQGCLAGAPRAGMDIATVDIAQSSGWYDENGNGYFENTFGTNDFRTTTATNTAVIATVGNNKNLDLIQFGTNESIQYKMTISNVATGEIYGVTTQQIQGPNYTSILCNITTQIPASTLLQFSRTYNPDFDGTATGGPAPVPVPGDPVITGEQSYIYAGGSGDTGKVNFKSGVQSVIGEIIAVRQAKHHILGRTTDCYEVYVSNFINPATLDDVNSTSHTFPATAVTRADTFAVNTAPITLYKRCHGASHKSNGYNFNPSFNTINGAQNKVNQLENEVSSTPNQRGGYKGGTNSGTPLGYNYIQSANTANPSYATDVATGGDAEVANQEQMGLGMPEGLSFLWNGTHTSFRKTSFVRGNLNRFRANSFMQPYRQQGTLDLFVKHLIQDVVYVARPAATQTITFLNDTILKQQGSVPVCLGAYVICNRDTILDIAKGRLDGTFANNFYAQTNYTPRIWLDWGFQARQSDYTTRHYVGNSWNTRAAGSSEADSPPGSWTARFPGVAVLRKELRWGYSFLGRPNNINWRKSIVNNGNLDITVAQTQSDVFGAMAYSNYWVADAAPDPTTWTDFTPTYMSYSDGMFPPNDRGEDNVFRGLPIVWAGYNTCVNSIYFQQKDTGDVNLGLGSWRARGIVTTAGVRGASTISISNDLTDIDTGEQRVLPTIAATQDGLYQIKILQDNCQFNPVELISDITIGAFGDTYDLTLLHTQIVTQEQPGGANITFEHSDPKWLLDINIGTQIIFYYKSAGGVGIGLDATPWSSDLLMIKENIAKFKVNPGFYTEQQLAEEVNNALHYDNLTYASKYGVKDAQNNYSIPTNVGKSSRARPSEPSVVHGVFQQTHLPDVSFGFTPITPDNANDLEQTAQTKELTDLLYTYEPETTGVANTFVYRWPENIATERPYNGTTVRKITDNSAQYPTMVGKHLKVYGIPHNTTDPRDRKELCLMRLRGGALNETDFPTGDAETGRWNNVVPRMVGNLEMLRATDQCYWNDSGSNDIDPDANIWWQSTAGVYAYRTRLTRNLFPNGGASRVICGANNLTFSWEEGANRYSLNNLYTPLRPHEVETADDKKGDFGIGDAIPSAIISSKHNGKIVSQLTGVYINDLNAPAFTRELWGREGLDEYWEYDTVTDTEQEIKGLDLLTIFGYTEAQVNANINSFNIVSTPFTYKSDLLNNGSAIRVGAKVTPAVNSSNPVASRCLNIAPVQQFFVQIDSDDFFAEKVPKKGDSPYYFIGSNFPSKQFYGNLNGAKLPIVGICSRNFSAFNFVFDLGGSAISYLIDENTTITHIETKIYNAQMKTPNNLSPSSSVIYLITRYNYSKNITDPKEQQYALNQMIADNQAPILNEFYSQPTANFRTALPAIVPPINSPYFTGFGQMLPPIPEEEEEEY